MEDKNIVNLRNMSEEERSTYLIESIRVSEFIRHLDIEFVKLTSTEAVGRMKLVDKYLNPYGSMHGGCIYALADTVAGTLACMCGQMVTTVDGHVNYFSPVIKTEYVYCNAKLIRSGKHMCNVSVTLTGDDDRLFDDGTFNYFKLV